MKGNGDGRKGKRPITYWLRWPAVLPAGLLAAVLISFPVHWAILFLYNFAGHPDASITAIDSATGEEKACALMGLTCLVPPKMAESIAIAGAAPFALITFGAKVAPSHKFYAAATLFTLWMLSYGGFLAWGITYAGIENLDVLHYLGVAIAGIAGACATIYAHYKDWGEARSAS